jgi:hypothetical protein
MGKIERAARAVAAWGESRLKRAEIIAFSTVIPREGGESSTPRLLDSITTVSEYWIARSRPGDDSFRIADSAP